MSNPVFDGKDFSKKASGFDHPTQLPSSDDQERAWQKANRAWWEQAPMRYDWRETINAEPGSKDYFEEIDRRFFSQVAQYMPWNVLPFDNLIDFGQLAERDTLEIGVGHGSHAQLIAPHCRRYIGIDLTQRAVEMTRKRLSLNGIAGEVMQMDAEEMLFESSSFDFVWSWGVIHHSANTEKILMEVRRVLRPRGKAVVMVYHRSKWKYYVMDGFLKGVALGAIFRQGSLHRVSQTATDGAIARNYTIQEWKSLCDDILQATEIFVTGQKADIIPLPAGKLKRATEILISNRIARLLTNRFRFGSFLISKLTLPEIAE